MTLSLLIVEDDESLRETLVEFFETFGYTVRGAGTATDGRKLAVEHAPDVVLLDLKLPDANGVVALEALRADDPDVGVVLLTGFADVRTAVRAMQRGASDVLEKPVDLDVLAAAVVRAAERGRMGRELAMLRQRARAGSDDGSTAPKNSFSLTHSLAQLIDLAARNVDAPVLLQGETGTGKGYIARQIHDRSARNQFPFVEVNCASLSSTFFESELFGYERGAFTDAKQAKRGLFEIAGEGTVFLDEVADTTLDVQPKLLKVIEEQTFRRLGGTTVLRSAARVIVATHQPLAAAVAERRFRADLFYRLQVLTLTLPTLRSRPDAIPELAEQLLPRGASLGTSAITVMQGYSWPGNIRELKNTLWRAAILADGRPIERQHLGLPQVDSISGSEQMRAGSLTPVAGSLTLEAAERAAIASALRAASGNRSKAARELGIARSTLLEKLKKYPELTDVAVS
ncbi:MAG TPA: sigma-54 dependent transcriptional regulator [Gemmatimonas sp.]|nr:sigma-54 dependent transcriptional regulator [Gemmatimonas sp.]